ncbi:MAG: hypothetical protein WCV68_01795 [Candidatus Paceibacterota bacterium]
MRDLLKEMSGWEQSWLSYLQYSYSLTFWLYLNRWRRLQNFFGRKFDVLLRFGFAFLGLIIGIFLVSFGGHSITQDILSNYLIAVGAMSGGAIAIVFTISIFMIQSASDLYSSQYFDVYIHDWKEKIVYLLVIIITLLFFGAGLYVGGLETILEPVSSYITLISLILAGAIFALIDWQYKTVRQKINPANAIYFLEKQAIQFLNLVESDARKIAKVMVSRDKKLSENEALAKTYNTFLQPYFNNLDRQIENLVEISLKLSDKQEVGTTKRGFIAVRNILGRFLEVRRTSSIAMPSAVAFLAVESDSQRFLFNNFERLNKAGEKFIREGKDGNATLFLSIYEFLALKAKDITYVGQTNENPILESLEGNLSQFIDIGKRGKNLEVVFQSIDKLGNIGEIASDKGLTPMLRGIQDKLQEIAFYGLAEKQLIIIDQCNINLLKIIGASFFSKKMVTRYQVNPALEHIATIAQYVFVSRQSGYIPSDISSSLTMTKAYDQLYIVIAQIVNYYFALTEKREKDSYRNDIVEFFEELYGSLRALSEKIKNCDSHLAESVGRLLFTVNSLIIEIAQNTEFSGEKMELYKHLGWNLHLPYWFTHHAEKFDGGSNNFRSLVESVAKTGLLVMTNLQNKKLASDSINSLSSMAGQAIDKTTEGYGYDEPRIFERACYLGILALKYKWEDVYAELKLKILDFEKKYNDKYFSNLPVGVDPDRISPNKEQLYVELGKWRYNFDYEKLNGNMSIRDDAQSMMYSLIDVADIDWFTYKVWGKWPADSPANDDIEEDIKSLQEKAKSEETEEETPDDPAR